MLKKNRLFGIELEYDCEYKEFNDNMYDRLVRKGDNWDRGLVCFDCDTNEDNEIKPAPIRVFEALGEILSTEL